MYAKSQNFFRVMCGRKAHSKWFPIETEAWKAAAEKHLASTDQYGRFYFGPLVWIEVGLRASERARTIPIHDGPDFEKLPLRNRPILVGQPGALRRKVP